MRNTAMILLIPLLMLTLLPINPASGYNPFDKMDNQILLQCKNNEPVDVFVELKQPCLIQNLTSDGLYQTSSQEITNDCNVYVKVLMKSLLNEQRHLASRIEKIIGFKPETWLQYLGNGCVLNVSPDKAKKIADLPQVKFVHYCPPMELSRFKSRQFLNTTRIYTDVVDRKGAKVDGNGILCAVTDTGIDYTHKDFLAQKAAVGKKVVISRDLGEKDDDCQEIPDKTSHGTGCASLLAGDGPDNEKGIAPKALLAGYKISDANGNLTSEAVYKSFEYLIMDKIQVSSNSFGRPFGSSRGYEPNLINNAVLAGCVVVAAQGNNGSPGEYLPVPCGNTGAPNLAISVGATDETEYSSVIIDDTVTQENIGKKLVGQWGTTGKSFAKFDTPIQVVDCGWGRLDDFAGLDLKGKIALIQRGPMKSLQDKFGPALTFRDKNLNAMKAGAIMMILYNYDPDTLRASYSGQNPNAPLDPNLIPSLHLMRANAELLRTDLHKGNTWESGTIDSSQNNVFVKITKTTNKANLAEFTSIGPTTDLMLKPDVCAPGVSIRAASPKWTKVDYTDSFGGTSAACPLTAGCAALILQAKPEWKPQEVKRAMMNTATLLTRFVDDRYIQLTAQGQGRVNAYEAVRTDVLIQPPSALIVSETKAVNIADPPTELKDLKKRDQIDSKIRTSTLPLKFSNYSIMYSSEYELSYVVNSRYADSIKVEFTDQTVSLQKAKSSNIPFVSWVGVNIDFPTSLKGDLNDVIIFAENKTTGQKLHVGVCIYTDLFPNRNTYASEIALSTEIFTPNGDGETDSIKFDFTVTNGSISFIPSVDMHYTNFADSISFYAIDMNSERWVKMYEGANLEMGFHSFTWDGKDEKGNYVLPEGEWYVQVSTSNSQFSNEARAWVPFDIDYDLMNKRFVIESSTIQPLPTFYPYSLPMEPGVGQEFQIGIYIRHAINLKSLQFKIDLSSSEGIVKYLGADLGEFMNKDGANPLAQFDFNDENKTLFIDIQRPTDGVSGEGYIATLRFLALESNYFDIDFKNVQVTVLDFDNSSNPERIAKAFYKKGEFVIQKIAYDRLDFNLDGVVDGKDLSIISSKLGSKKGDGLYLWRCDLNYDSLIDFEDFEIFTKGY